MDQTRRIRLGADGSTASSAEIDPDGVLVIELYDFSDEAQSAFGNDVAYLIRIAPADQARMRDLLRKPGDDATATPDPGEQLLRWLAERFTSYFQVQAWLDQNSIPYTKEFDSWA